MTSGVKEEEGRGQAEGGIGKGFENEKWQFYVEERSWRTMRGPERIAQFELLGEG